jgi:hypothetical protein
MGDPARHLDLWNQYIQAASLEAQTGISTGQCQVPWDKLHAYERIEKNMQVELRDHGTPQPPDIRLREFVEAASDVTEYKLSEKRAAPSFNVAVKELGAALAGPEVVPQPVAPQSGGAPKR